MPELPEVETVRRALEPVMVGRRLVRVDQRRPDLRFPFPERFVDRLTGAAVVGLRRRAKYMLADLDRGEALLIHLGMSGRMTIHAGGAAPAVAGARINHGHLTHSVGQPTVALYHEPSRGNEAPCAIGEAPHDHVVFDLDDGTRIVFNDHRRFGMMDLFPIDAENDNRFLRHLGPEPMGNAFSAHYLDQALHGKATPIKSALLDQRIVAGLGNIYVCEALYRSGISPRRLARSVPGKRAARLAPAVRDVLADAIEAGGSSLRDYVHADGSLGYFQHTFSVYDREGESCRRAACDGVIRRIVQAGRSSFFCPKCQR